MPVARAPKDTDSAESAFRLQRLAWSVVGGTLAAAAGALIAGPLVAVLLFPVGVGVIYLVTGLVMHTAARGMSILYAPSGKSTPPPRGWSREEALVLQQRPGEAAALYEAATFDDPEDPEPFLRLARLHRDHLASPGDAVRWYRVARETVRITRPQSLAAAMELVELCRKEGRLEEAAPELRWIVANFRGTPAADVAGQDLAAVRAEERS